MGYIWKFDNVETQNKHEVSLGFCLFKMHLSFSKYWLGPCRINAQAWQVTETFISCLKLWDGPFSFDYIESNAFTKFWLFTMPPKHGLYTMAPTMGLLKYKEIQMYNEEASFWMTLPS